MQHNTRNTLQHTHTATQTHHEWSLTSHLSCTGLCVSVCVCVRERERERIRFTRYHEWSQTFDAHFLTPFFSFFFRTTPRAIKPKKASDEDCLIFFGLFAAFFPPPRVKHAMKPQHACDEDCFLGDRSHVRCTHFPTFYFQFLYFALLFIILFFHPGTLNGLCWKPSKS